MNGELVVPLACVVTGVVQETTRTNATIITVNLSANMLIDSLVDVSCYPPDNRCMAGYSSLAASSWGVGSGMAGGNKKGKEDQSDRVRHLNPETVTVVSGIRFLTLQDTALFSVHCSHHLRVQKPLCYPDHESRIIALMC